MLLSELKEEYLVMREMEGLSKASIRTMGDAINLFIKFTEDAHIEKVGKVVINRFIKDMMQRVKHTTINYRITILKAMFQFAKKEEIIDENPFMKVSRLKESKLMKKTYSQKDIDYILNSFKGKTFTTVRNKTIITFLAETGMRNSELRGIKLSDLLDGSIILQGKGDKQRSVPITKPMQVQLFQYKRARDKYMDGEIPCEYLFVSRTRKQLTRYGLLQMMKDLGEALGVDVCKNIHGFRRFYARQMLENVDLYTVSRLLGHARLATTEKYIQGIEDKEILQKGMNSPLSNRK